MKNKITQLFSIKEPIIQAGMVWCSGWRLASAVSNNGGLGVIGSGSMRPDVLREHIQKCRLHTKCNFAVNLPLLFPYASNHIDVIIQENVPIVFTSAGNPEIWTQKLKNHNIIVVHVVSNLKLAYESKGETLINDFEKNISLAIIDESWKNHLRKMDELKQSVQLAVHEQKDPLVIYKFEAFKLFQTTLNEINKEIISFLFKGELPSKDPSEIREDRKERRKQKFNISKEEVLNSDELASINRNAGQNVSSRNQPIETIVRETKKIGRNEKVTIKNISNGEQKTLKYKIAENHLKNGDWILVND